ncbi:MAG TPA: hypothetical protein VMD30_07500 [Tepidisphaeraceae bacterium]|nr:hypothetical protein [Tepidisphaeraceae bacterium]
MNAILNMIHWWVPVGIIAIGAIFFIVANKRTNTSTRSVGLAIVGLGVLIGVGRFLFPTDEEKCEALTRQLTRDVVTSAGSGKWDSVKADLSPNTTVNLLQYGSAASGPADIATDAQQEADKYGLEVVNVMSMQAHEDPVHEIIVTTTMASTGKATLDEPIVSYWEFDWRRNPKGGFILDAIKLQGLAENGS